MNLIEALEYCLEDSMYNEEDVINELSLKFSKEHIDRLLFEDVIKSAIQECDSIEPYNHEENRIILIDCVKWFFNNNQLAIDVANEQFDIWENFWNNFNIEKSCNIF